MYLEEYDSDGKRTKIVVYDYDTDGTIINHKEEQYENNKLVKWITYDANGKEVDASVLKYDVNGKQNYLGSYKEGHLVSEKFFNENGACIKEIEYDEEGNIIDIIEY